MNAHKIYAENTQRFLLLRMSILLSLLFWGATSGNETAKNNVASVFITRSSMGENVQIDDFQFLLGNYGIQDTADLHRAIDIWGDGANSTGGYLHALALYVQGDYAATVTEMRSVQTEFQIPVEGLLLGHAWYALGDATKAGDVWREAGVDFPLQVQANKDFRTGQFEAALPLYQRLETIWPQDDEIQLKLGDIYRSMTMPDYEQAISYYQRAADLGYDPDSIQLLILITELAATRDSESVSSQLEAMLARTDLTPNNRVTALRVMHNIYRYYFADSVRAASYLESAAELPRMEGDIWEELQIAQIYLESGDCEKAQRWIVTAEERFLDGVSPLALFLRLRQGIREACG